MSMVILADEDPGYAAEQSPAIRLQVTASQLPEPSLAESALLK